MNYLVKCFLDRERKHFAQYIKNKVLFFLLQKYTRSNLNKEDIDNSYNSEKKDLELIYYKFRKKSKKLFLLPD